MVSILPMKLIELMEIGTLFYFIEKWIDHIFKEDLLICKIFSNPLSSFYNKHNCDMGPAREFLNKIGGNKSFY